MKLTATPVPYSSVVGQSVSLTREDGSHYAMLSIHSLPVSADYKTASGELAAWLCELMNRDCNTATDPIADAVAKENEVTPSSGNAAKDLGLSVIDEIAWERRRQIEVEKWDAERDDEYKSGELVRAAVCYAHFAAIADEKDYSAERLPNARDGYVERILELWPWEWLWWKPKDRRRDLVRAAALIVAEIERLDRARIATPEQKEGE